jgi:hypothetical protein
MKKLIFFSSLLPMFIPSTVLAADDATIGAIGIKPPDLGRLVANVYLIALFAASLFFFIQLLVGGISWMGAGGDPKAMTSARNRLMNAIIGLVIVVAAFAISVIVTSALGINIFSLVPSIPHGLPI